MYILLAIIGFTLLAGVSILDKFILSKQVASSTILTFYNSIVLLPLVILLFFDLVWPASAGAWGAVIISGVGFWIGLIFLFKGITESEISHIGPLLGAIVPIFTVIFSSLFLSEVLDNHQLLAVGLLVLGCLIISFENSHDHHGWHRGMWWGILSGAAFAASHTASKYIYGDLGFYSGLVLSRTIIGVCGLLMLFLPAVRKNIFVKKTNPSPKKKSFLVLFNLVLAFGAILLVQYAISLGSVSIVNSLESVRYGFLVILVAVMSKFFPKLFKEDYSRGEIWQEIIAVIIIAVGLFLLI